MTGLSFSFVDLLVVAVIVISTVYATYRGFVSETLSIFAWAAAAFATLYFGPFVAPLARGMFSPGWLGDVIGYAAVFLVVFIPLSFASYRFAEGVKKSPVSALDRSLGGAFGVVRGLAIIGIAYLVFSSFVAVPQQPHWMKNALTLPLIQGSSEVILSLVPHRDREPVAESRSPPPATAAAPSSRPQTAEKTAPKKADKKAYGAKDRQALDRLIEATGSGGNSKP